MKQQLAKLQEENDVEKKELETAYASVITNQKGDLAEQRSGQSFLSFVILLVFNVLSRVSCVLTYTLNNVSIICFVPILPAYEELQTSVNHHKVTVSQQRQEISRLKGAHKDVVNESSLLRKALESAKEDAIRIRSQRDAAAKRLTAESRRIQSIVSSWDKQKEQMNQHIKTLERGLKQSETNGGNSEETVQKLKEKDAKIDTLTSKLDLEREIAQNANQRAAGLEKDHTNVVSILQQAASDVKALKEALKIEREKVEGQAKDRHEMAIAFEEKLKTYQEEHQAKTAKMEIFVENSQRKLDEMNRAVQQQQEQQRVVQQEHAAQMMELTNENEKLLVKKNNIQELEEKSVLYDAKYAQACAQHRVRERGLMQELNDAKSNCATVQNQAQLYQTREVKLSASLVTAKKETKKATEALHAFRQEAQTQLKAEKEAREECASRLTRAMEAITLFEQKVTTQQSERDQEKKNYAMKQMKFVEIETKCHEWKQKHEATQANVLRLEKDTIMRERRVEELEQNVLNVQETNEQLEQNIITMNQQRDEYAQKKENEGVVRALSASNEAHRLEKERLMEEQRKMKSEWETNIMQVSSQRDQTLRVCGELKDSLENALRERDVERGKNKQDQYPWFVSWLFVFCFFVGSWANFFFFCILANPQMKEKDCNKSMTQNVRYAWNVRNNKRSYKVNCKNRRKRQHHN